MAVQASRFSRAPGTPSPGVHARDDSGRVGSSPFEVPTSFLQSASDAERHVAYRFDEYELDTHRLELRRDGVPVKADAMVLRLLCELVAHAGRLVTKDQLIARVWDDRVVSENVITVAVTRLRKTLGHEKGRREFVLSVHGRGYRFVRPVAERDAERLTSQPTLRGLPFVGRDDVLGRLRQAMQSVPRGAGGAYLVVGEAGIGKTSLAEVAGAEAARAGFTVAWGYCREAGDTPPLWPFVRLMRDALERAPAAARDERLLSAVTTLEGALPELSTHGAARVGGEERAHPPFARHRLFESILTVLSLLSERTPCVLVLDDLHRADSASLEVLRRLIDEIARTRILLIGTLRSGVTLEPPAGGHLAYVVGHRNSTRVLLDRLNEAVVGDYVESVHGERDEALARSVYLKSEGNPFFMVELSRLLRDGRDEGAVPAAALDLLRRRVAALSPPSCDVLSTAALIGNTFDLPLLCDVSGLSHGALMATLDEAIATDLIAAQPESRTTFRFRHDLLRAVLHDRLDEPRRRVRHLEIVGALERRRTSGGLVPDADLAYHAYSAIPDGDARRAVQYCRDAATAAVERRAFGDAARYLRQAREALELVQHPSAKLRLQLLLQHALYARTCSSPEFEPTVREALRLGREQSQPSAIAYAALLFDVHPGFPALEGARAALEEARDALDPSADATAAVHSRLLTSPPTSYDDECLSAELARVRALGEKTDALLPGYTLRSVELYLRGGPRHHARASKLLDELEVLCEDNPRTLSVTPVLMDLHRAIVAAQRGDTASAVGALERAIGRCRDIDHHELEWHAQRYRILLRAGETTTDVAVELRRHHLRAERESLLGTDLFVAYDQVVVLGAADAGAAYRALSAHRDDPPNLWALKLRALVATGRYDEARAALHRLRPGELERLPEDRDYIGTLGALTRAAIALDELEYLVVLERLLAPYGRWFAVNVAFFCEGSVSELLDAIAAALGRRAARASSDEEIGVS